MAIYRKSEEGVLEVVSEIQSVETLVSTRDPICDPKADLLSSDCSKVVLEALNSPAPPVEETLKSSTSTKMKETK